MKQPKKVLIIGMSPIKGGIEMLLMQVFRSVDRKDITFDFLTFCEKCVFEEEILSAGSQVFHVTRRGVNPIKNRRELIAFYKAHPNTYDFIWYHLSSASNCLPVVLAKKYTNAKIVCHSHGTSFDSRALFRPIHLLLDKINNPKLLKCTDFCFACSQAAGDWLFKGSDKPITVIKNGISIEKHRYSEETRNRIRNEMQLNDSFVIGHAGRFCEAKNQPFIVDVFNAFQKTHPNSLLLLAGEGETQTAVREQVERLGLTNQVRFLGFRDDFAALLQAFDLFLMPSLYEGLPISAIEAQTAGVPCLLADTITKETAITDLVNFMSLEDAPERWAERIAAIQEKTIERSKYVTVVSEAGYSDEQTVNDIVNFFLKN
ncbi:MAG: glycosyltransferase family 1 protein [Clostridia bacterium]|nr:glycosyltransferase family 1 protein [Clostridia bacterium]